MDESRGLRGQPRYQEMADLLIEEIAAGHYPVGSMMPTEHELCERFEVSRYTVREALRRLEEIGLIARRQGSGTIVQARDSEHGYVQSLSSLAQLLQYPAETRFSVSETRTLTADRATARFLRCRAGEERVCISGIRRIGATGKPICWTDVYLRPEYAGIARAIGKTRQPVYEMVEKTFGERIEQVEVELFASAVPEKFASALEVEPGTPAMTIIRRYTGHASRVFEVSASVHPQGRFTYSIAFSREWRPVSAG